jgi:transcriptional regulator with XRE-family HTH domain
MKAFGLHLRKLRESKGLTQEELAYRADVAISSIGRIETGNLNTSVSTIVILAKALGVHKRDMLDF